MHFLREMEEKQASQCRATWQLNPHRDCVSSTCWLTTQTLASVVHLIKHMKYFSSSITTEHIDDINEHIVLVLLSTAALALDRFFSYPFWLVQINILGLLR